MNVSPPDLSKEQLEENERMAIIGITNDTSGDAIQRLSVSTKLAIGLPPQGSRNYPTKIDHFVFLRKSAGSKNLWEEDPELTEFYTKKGTVKPREVDIIVLDDELENIFPTKMAWWNATMCLCSGDGRSAIRRTADAPKGKPWKPCALEGCPDLAKGVCKPSGDLRFMLADFPRLGAIARIHTSSARSIQQIHSSLQQIQIITGGRLAGIRATLTVRPEKTSYEQDGERHATTIYALSLEMKADRMHKMLDKMTETARLFEQTRKLLGGGHIEVIDEEEPELAAEIAPEFYPPTQPENPAPAQPQGEVIPPTKQAESAAQPNIAATDFISDSERVELFKLCSAANVSGADLKQYLKENFDVDSTMKIPKAVAIQTTAWLKSVAETKQ